jgi:maltoporin
VQRPLPSALAAVALALAAPGAARAQIASPENAPPTQQPAGAADPAPSSPGQTATNTPAAVPTPGATVPVPPVSTPAPPPRGAEGTPPAPADGFSFGSYGRVVAATDLRGHTGREANIVAHGTRIDEQTYAELEVHRDDTFGHVRTRVVATLALTGPLFHQNGTFDVRMAVRNLYIEERGALDRNLALWVGSRMYRGDDVYLLNWWPLDNLNTVGGGARYDVGDAVTLAAHVGTNRLDSAYQYQQIRVTPRDGVGATQVVLLDRPRFISSFKATWWLMGRTSPAGVKVSVYGEAHALPEGVRQNTDNTRTELLPADSGWVLGAQVGAYTGVRNTYVNLFFRYAQGLGAYGDLAVPYTLTARQTSARARDVVLALAGNWESGPFGLLAGAYVRYFQDADAAIYGRNDLVEGTLALRPQVWIGEHFGIAIDASYQAQSFNMLDPVTGTGPRSASMWRFGVIPFVSPAGRGSFTRPHLRLIYAATVRDAGAQRLYAPDDPFAFNAVEHYLGLGCEWWFNSSYL